MSARQRTKAILKEAFPSIWLRWHLMHHPKSAEQELLYLDRIVPGDASKDPGLIQAVRSQFGQIISDEYAQQFSASVRGQVKVKRNDQALAKLKSELMANAAAQ